MNDVVLELDEVVKRFGDNEVLSGVTIKLHRHEVVCLIGASGSGKSTVARAIVGPGSLIGRSSHAEPETAAEASAPGVDYFCTGELEETHHH